jgi:hypothetical protein
MTDAEVVIDIVDIHKLVLLFSDSDVARFVLLTI